MMKMIRKLENKYGGLLQFVKFGLVGVSNTAISYAVYYAAVFIDKKYYLPGYVLGFVLGVLNAYYWNSRFVFKKTDEKTKTVFKTFVCYGFTGALSVSLLYLFVQWLHISEYLAPVLTLLVTVPANFFINKYWAYKVKEH